MSGVVPTEAECRELVQRVLKLSKADEVQVTIEGGQRTHLRFARSTPSTSGRDTDTSLAVQSTFGARSAVATVNQLDQASLERVVSRSEELARLAPENPEYMPGLGPAQYVSVPHAYHSDVSTQGSRQIAAGTAVAIKAARDAQLVAAGYSQATAAAVCIGNSHGMFGYHRATAASFSQTVRTPDGTGSGWGADIARSVADIDYAAAAGRAVEKARRSVSPRQLAPGSYVTILEPACVASMLAVMFANMSARTADEGRSYFSADSGGNRRGQKLFSDLVSIESDPESRVVPAQPFAGDGQPQSKRDWVRDGRLENLVYERFWAKKQGVAPMPGPCNVIMHGGSGSLEELIKTTKRGVLVTSLWYIRTVDPRTMLHTGLTRDGVFWIENGEVQYPVTNFRWNDSPIAVLKNVEAMSEAVRVAPRGGISPTTVVPALRVRQFELTSVSEAV